MKLYWYLSVTSLRFLRAFGWSVIYWWPLSVQQSIQYVNLTWKPEELRKLKIGRKEVRDTVDSWPHLEVKRSNTCGGRNFGAAQLVCFTGMLMSNVQLAYYELQAESSGWLLKSPLAGGGGQLQAAQLVFICRFSCILNIMYPVYYVLLLILYAHYPVALRTLYLQLHAFCFCFCFVLFHIFHMYVIILL